jgi:hypothetical protein
VNKKVITIFILTLIAMIALWAFSFGLFSGTGVIKNNPQSLKSTTQQIIIDQKNTQFNTYHNKDVPENFYTIKFPQAWQLQQSNALGSYHFLFDNGSGVAELQDVADNTTLELFILSQEEPRLKKSASGYQRVSYNKISVNGKDAYQLVYRSIVNGVNLETEKTYIVGPDHAGVITLTASQSNFANLQPTFTFIVNSFQWENK